MLEQACVSKTECLGGEIRIRALSALNFNELFGQTVFKSGAIILSGTTSTVAIKALSVSITREEKEQTQ